LVCSRCPAPPESTRPLVEPTWLPVTRLDLNPQPTCRFVHFTDFHHKGDTDYAAEMVRTISALEPKFVGFTVNLVEDRRFCHRSARFHPTN
jgi:hypothetical protein